LVAGMEGKFDDAVKQFKEKGFVDQETKDALARMETKTAEIVTKAEAIAIELKEEKAKREALEVKLNRLPNGGEGNEHKSWGKQVAEQIQAKGLEVASGNRRQFKMEGKAIVSDNTAVVGAGVVAPQRQAGVITAPTFPFTIRSLIPATSTTSATILYVKEGVFTNNAAIQKTQGAKKAESTITYTSATSQVVTIAHFIKVSTQMLADIPYIQGQVDGRLRYGLQDWGAIELLKNTLGNYLIGDPQGTTAPRLWGLPVAQSFEIGANKVLVGAFAQGAEIFDREEGNVQLAFTNEDDFVRNLATLRAEERVGLAVYRPAAFIKGDFTAMQAA
jgi:uncharacterized protein YidB (DUF937 family)